jgi:hypothetical protein
VIAHIGTQTRDIGPYCVKCQSRAVRFEGATCFSCRREIRSNRALWVVVIIVFISIAIMMAASQAIGTWIAINVDGTYIAPKVYMQEPDLILTPERG